MLKNSETTSDANGVNFLEAKKHRVRINGKATSISIDGFLYLWLEFYLSHTYIDINQAYRFINPIVRKINGDYGFVSNLSMYVQYQLLINLLMQSDLLVAEGLDVFSHEYISLHITTHDNKKTKITINSILLVLLERKFPELVGRSRDYVRILAMRMTRCKSQYGDDRCNLSGLVRQSVFRSLLINKLIE